MHLAEIATVVPILLGGLAAAVGEETRPGATGRYGAAGDAPVRDISPASPAARFREIKVRALPT